MSPASNEAAALNVAARLKPTERFAPVKGTCQCATCRLSAGLRIVETAVEEWLDSSEERSMSYAWLADEVEAVLQQPWWRPNRKRLREALRVAKNTPGTEV